MVKSMSELHEEPETLNISTAISDKSALKAYS